MQRLSAGRSMALLLLLLPLTVRLSADDHFRTGGVVESEPFTEMTATRIDQRFHIQDVATTGVKIHYNCHAGDTINPGTLDFVIPAGVAMNWDTSKTGGSAPVVNWQATGSSVGSRVTFNGYPNSKTMRFDVASTFTPITDFFWLTGHGFTFPDPDFPAPGTFPKFADNFNLNANAINGVFPLNHTDTAFVRLARPPSGFGLSGPLTLDAGPGPTLMTPVTLTESNTVGNGGIWAATGIKINIPPNGVSGLNMTWHNPGGAVQATCTGTAVSALKIAANPTVSFLDGNKTVLIPVANDFGPGESVTITGLSFANMGNDSSGFLRLNLGNSSAVTVAHAVDTNPITISGQPKISSFQSKVFTVGDPITVIEDVTITESLGTPRITSVNDITIVLPPALAAVASFASSTITCTGTAVPAHVAAGPFVVNPNPGNKSITIPVAGTFGSGQTVTIVGLRMTSFTGALGSAQLGLDVNGSVGTFEAVDDKTMGIGRPSISSDIDQVFFVAPPNLQAMAQITITDDAANPRIFPGTQMRITIPGPFNMTWQGSGVPTVSPNLSNSVSYVPGNKTLIVTAGGSWTPGGSGTITGLNFNVTTASLPDNLELFMSATGTVTSLDDKFIVIGGIPTMSSGANPTFNQQFTVNDPSTLVNMITLTDATDPSFQAGNSLQIVIPNGLNLEWNTGIAPTIGGTGASHVTNPALVYSYPDDKTLEIAINTTFGAGQTLTLSNLQFANFSGASSPLGLQVRVSVGGPIAATDNRTKAIGAPTIVSLTNQVFGVGDPPQNAAQITITDDGTTPRILPGTNLKIRIPGTFDMDWAATQPVITGTAAAKVGTPVIAGKIMTIPVITPFTGGQTLILNGAQFTNFVDLSSLSFLELEVNNAGGSPNAFDSSTIKIGTRPTITGVRTLDTNRNGSIDQVDVKFSEAISGAGSSIAQGSGFTLTGYSIAAGAVDGVDPTIVHYALIQTGLPDTGALPALTYDPDNGGNLTDVNDNLRLTQLVAPLTVDGAAPVITGFTAVDSDGNGFLDQVVATFSENLAAGQSDVNDWVLVDADGSTNLMIGRTNGDIVILNNTVTINLSDATGTAGTPRFQYLDDGLGGQLQDQAPIPNFVGTLTNNTVPVAQAGPDISAVPTKITLNGTASFDPDGQALTFSWTQVPIATVALLNAGTPTPSFQTALPGPYTFRLDVSDGLATTSDFVTVNILNVTPTAVAVQHQVVQAGTLVTLRGVQSTDINGDALSYAWSQSAGPATALSDATIENPTFTPLAAGAYEYELAVKDTAGNLSPKNRVRVLVHSGGNFVPTADAGPDQVVTSGTLVTLDARLSSTPSTPAVPPLGLEPTYTWTSAFLGAPVTGTSPTLTFTPPGPGTYTFTLIVHDTIANLDSFPDTVSVLVYNPSNRPPAAVASKLSPAGTPLVGEVVTLDATASVDPEGGNLDYAWVQTAGPKAFFDNPGAPLPKFTPILPGSYEFQLLVHDGVHVSPPTTLRLVVKRDLPYVVPTIDLSFTAAAGINATTGHVLDTGLAVNLIATVTPVTSTWWWEQIGGPAVVLQPSPLGFDTDPSFVPVVPGLYRFRATVTDHTGGMVHRGIMEIATIDIVVDDAGNAAPVADAGPNQNSILTGQLVTLNGLNSQDDNTAFGGGLTPYWRQLFGPPVQISDPYSPQPTFVPTSAGIYVFELVVDDGTSSTKPSVTQVFVAEAPGGGGGGSSGGGGSCGLSGLEALALIGLAAGMRRRRGL